MGIVARQSFKAAITTYFGVVMGVINNLLIYPYMISVEQYGEVQFVLQTATFFTPFLMLGFGTVLIKFFPIYSTARTEKERFYSLVLGAVSLNVIFFLFLAYLFGGILTSYYSDSTGVSILSIYVLIGVSAILPFVGLSKNFAANKGRIAIPAFFSQLIKFVLPLLVVAYYYNVIGFSALILALLIYHLVLLIVCLLYAYKQDPFKFRKPNFSSSKIDTKSILVFAFFSVLSGIGATLMNQVDILMITAMKGVYQNGLYAWSLFIANAIAIPYGIIASITLPIISHKWKENNLADINNIYKKTSSTMMVISICLFSSLWVVLDDIFSLMPKGDEYKFAKYVILILCVAKIIDMASGLNNQLISMSNKYKILLVFLSISVILNVGLNFLLIPKLGIEGSAIATIVSIVVFNVLKFGYLWLKYRIQPFTFKSLIIVVLGVVLVLSCSLIPKTNSHLVNVLLFSSLVGVLFLTISYKLKLAPELNVFANKQLMRIGLKPFD